MARTVAVLFALACFASLISLETVAVGRGRRRIRPEDVDEHVLNRINTILNKELDMMLTEGKDNGGAETEGSSRGVLVEQPRFKKASRGEGGAETEGSSRGVVVEQPRFKKASRGVAASKIFHDMGGFFKRLGAGAATSGGRQMVKFRGWQKSYPYSILAVKLGSMALVTMLAPQAVLGAALGWAAYTTIDAALNSKTKVQDIPEATQGPARMACLSVTGTKFVLAVVGSIGGVFIPLPSLTPGAAGFDKVMEAVPWNNLPPPPIGQATDSAASVVGAAGATAGKEGASSASKTFAKGKADAMVDAVGGKANAKTTKIECSQTFLCKKAAEDALKARKSDARQTVYAATDEEYEALFVKNSTSTTNATARPADGIIQESVETCANGECNKVGDIIPKLTRQNAQAKIDTGMPPALRRQDGSANLAELDKDPCKEYNDALAATEGIVKSCKAAKDCESCTAAHTKAGWIAKEHNCLWNIEARECHMEKAQRKSDDHWKGAGQCPQFDGVVDSCRDIKNCISCVDGSTKKSQGSITGKLGGGHKCLWNKADKECHMDTASRHKSTDWVDNKHQCQV